MLAAFWAEPFQQADYLVGQGLPAFRRGLLQAQQAFVSSQQAVVLSDPAHAAGRNLNAVQHQLLRTPQRPLVGVFQGMVEDDLLDLGSGAVPPPEGGLSALPLKTPADLVGGKLINLLGI